MRRKSSKVSKVQNNIKHVEQKMHTKVEITSIYFLKADQYLLLFYKKMAGHCVLNIKNSTYSVFI